MTQDKILVTEDHGHWEPPTADEMIQFYRQLNDDKLLSMYTDYRELLDKYEFPPNKARKHTFFHDACKNELTRRGVFMRVTVVFE
jgi:hypothetical protein